MKPCCCPNFCVDTSYSPQTCCPPPPGSRESTGVVTQYGLKSPGVTAWFTVTRRFPYERRLYDASTDNPGRSSCWIPTSVSQLYPRVPQPVTALGSYELFTVG